MSRIKEIFTKVLPQKLKGFKVRDAQVKLSESIDKALKNKGTLLAESGTGTGKTWAYLVPIILSHHKSIISTGTKTLQEQIYYKDIPAIEEALGAEINSCILKGRSNYLCLYRYRNFLSERGELFEHAGIEEDAPAEYASYLKHIKFFASKTKSGDIAECPHVPENSTVWLKVTSTTQNCLKEKCLYRDECFVYRARERAVISDIVVVNHALTLSDMDSKIKYEIGVLPKDMNIIFDEAHSLPEDITNHMGYRFSNVAVESLFGELQNIRNPEFQKIKSSERHKFSDITNLINEYDSLYKALRLSVSEYSNRKYASKLKMEEFKKVSPLSFTVLEGIYNLLQTMGGLLKDLSLQYEVLKSISEEILALKNTLGICIHDEISKDDSVDQAKENIQQYVKWASISKFGVTLHALPLLVDFFGKIKPKNLSWILTSATLSVDGNFDYISKQLGLGKHDSLIEPSPFNYQENAGLLIPLNLPEPKDEIFLDEFVKYVLPLIRKVKGGVLILCTSINSVEFIAAKLRNILPERTILKQYQESTSSLVRKFLNTPSPILVATSTFWKGVDFPGEQLQLLIVEKLPFDSPSDPLVSARIENLENQGISSFMHHMVPQAAIDLKQGVGRLIRTETDHGLVVIADKRLITKGYGKRILNSLPDFKRIKDLEEALKFIESFS